MAGSPPKLGDHGSRWMVERMRMEKGFFFFLGFGVRGGGRTGVEKRKGDFKHSIGVTVQPLLSYKTGYCIFWLENKIKVRVYKNITDRKSVV